MENGPNEVVFAAMSSPTEPGVVFPYGQASVKVHGPRKRGRPVGSTKRKRTDVNTNDYHRLEFINLGIKPTEIDPGTRKTIKRRVMLNQQHLCKKHKERISDNGIEAMESMEDLPSEVVLSRFGRVDPFDTLPIRFEPYMHDLLSLYITTIWKTLYSIEKRSGCNPMVNYWLPLASSDPALLHTLIGCAASFVTMSNWVRGYSILVTHINEAMSILDRRIASSTNYVSDESLVVVASIAMMKKMLGFQDQWNMHMKRLKSLVDLRGGLDSLDDKPLIQSKIYRADLCGSVDATQVPYFGARYEGFRGPVFLNSHVSHGFQELDRLLKLEPLIKELILNLESTMITLTTIDNKGHQAVAAQVRFWVTSVQYRLLSISYKNSNDSRSQAQETCRLSLLLFTATAFNESLKGASTCDMLIAKLRELLDDDSICRWLTREFKLWALFLVACSVTDIILKSWCLKSISKVVSQVHIDREKDFARLLSMFLYDPDSHATSCRVLWSEMTAVSADIRRNGKGILR